MGEEQAVRDWKQLAHPLLRLPPETHRPQRHGRVLRARRPLGHNHGAGMSETELENLNLYILAL